MNANFGGFNSALLQARKSVWVMNVVSINGPNYLPLIHDRGFVGVLHDWYFNLLSVIYSKYIESCFLYIVVSSIA
jgi:hypothetical protein